MEIRDATEADLPRIVEIYNSAVPLRNVTANTEPITVESRVGWFRAHDPGRRPLWVAVEEEEEEVVGWLSLGEFYDGRPAYHATAEVGVYVAEGYRRKGLGRGLLGEAIRRAPELGLKTLTAGAFGHNGPSLRLFKTFGFERWARFPRVAEIDGVEHDLVVLGLRLDEEGGAS